ncbi:MAG: GGDEF domain-containing protein [Patescibacteria group bacterium]
MRKKNAFQERKEGFKHASIIFCDIDNFKSFNDKFGHKTGDLILKRISETLSENLRINDRICRWGGEEIIIALMGDDMEESKKVAERLRQAANNLTAQFKKEYRRHPDINEAAISLSLGLSVLSADKKLDLSIDEADAAMYVAKKSGGKNCVKVFSELDEKERQMAENFLLRRD